MLVCYCTLPELEAKNSFWLEAKNTVPNRVQLRAMVDARCTPKE